MQDFKKQKIKLTIFFSILIFCFAIFLEGIFFSFKYFNGKENNKKIFLKQTNVITEKLNKEQDILYLFENSFLENNLGNFRELKNKKNIFNNIGKRISYIILDKDNIIIEKRISENINFSTFDNLNKTKFYNKDSFFILEKELNNHLLGDKIIYYQKLKYTFEKLLEDLFLFIFITFLLSLLFYYFGIRFVNNMLKPIEENFSDMEKFIHNAGHEFKTPLSIIHSNLQIIKAEKKYDSQLIKENIDELINFKNLIDGLTELSGINLNLKKEQINLKKEIPEIISNNIIDIKKNKIKIKFDFKNNVKILANKSDFRIFFQNLLENAIKYNKIGGEIKITLNKNKLFISDTGIGIEKNNTSKIFDRFYRENNSKIGKGFGIGLSLVEKIASANNWKISLKSKKGIGTTFEIKF